MEACCKIHGCLVIAEFNRCETGNTGKCPLCGHQEFQLHGGWIECQYCMEFAVAEGAYNRMMGTYTRGREEL